MAFAQILANSLVVGSIYALVACGFSLLYTTNKFMHFAHGTSVAIAAYILYWLFALVGVPFYLACLLTLVFSAVFGLATYRFVYVPLQKKKSSNVILLIASIGLLILFDNVLLLLFGPNIKTIGYVKVQKGIEIFGALITPLQIVMILVSVVLLVVLYLFIQKTKLGRDMRAVADNPELASIVGINYRKIADWSFIIGSVLAGIAGILIGLEQNVRPDMGTHLMVRGFTAAIIGGIGSVPGSILGSYILGLAENFGIWWLPSGFKDGIAFGLLFLFLLLKPSGLLGGFRGMRR